MSPTPAAAVNASPRLPRTCGDEPITPDKARELLKSAPHLRG